MHFTFGTLSYDEAVEHVVAPYANGDEHVYDETAGVHQTGDDARNLGVYEKP